MHVVNFTRPFIVGVVFLSILSTPLISQAEMKIGFHSTVITPNSPVWMAGYASRTEPGEGKVHDLWAKAFAMEDDHGTQAVIVTADLIGLTLDVEGTSDGEAWSGRVDIAPVRTLPRATFIHETDRWGGSCTVSLDPAALFDAAVATDAVALRGDLGGVFR